MTNVSRHVGTDAADGHPGTERLRSFAADELADDSRRYVLEHLAACAHCRGLLAVVTPEEGPPVPVACAKKKAA